MKIRFAVPLVALAMCAFASAQQNEATPAHEDQKSTHADHMKSHAQRPKQFDKAIVQQLWKAWDTLDSKNAAKYYVQHPGHVFFDVAPLKYNDWSEYQTGVMQVFKDFKSLKTTVNDDLAVHDHGDTFVIVTSTLKFDLVTKEGKNETMNCRWTSIWVYMTDGWKMMHEHVSVPMQS